MSAPKRPESVPPQALWVAEENEWQIGTILEKGQPPRGECKAWRPDGSLAATYTLDAEGRVQGVLTRFHPDGTIASRGEWKDGDRMGKFFFQQSENPTPEGYEADERTWRWEFTAQTNWAEENQRWFAKDGTPLTSDGRVLALAFDMDPVIEISAPENFIERHGAACYQAFHGKEPAASRDADALAAFWGLQSQHFDDFSTLIGFGNYLIREFSDNCWESLITHPWLNMHEELSGIFMGAVCVGSIGDSDQVYVTLFNHLRPKPRANAVYFWNHELYYLDEVIANSLDDFAFACAIHTAHESERLSDAVAATAWRKLQNKVQLPYGLQSGIELVVDDRSALHKAFSSDIDPDGFVRSYYWRAQWLTRLLVVDSERNFDDVKEAFDASRNRPLNAVEFNDILQTGERVPPTAIYLLWRMFWCKDERLAPCLQKYAKHPARVVRDLVALIERFEGGLKGIGGIKDVQATRAKFLQLGLFG